MDEMRLDDLTATFDAAAPDASQASACGRAASDLSGTLKEIRYRAPSDGFTVVSLSSGEVAVGSDPHADLRIGVAFRFLGHWTTHARHGERFAFETFVRHVPHDREGVIAYLQKTAPHIGPGIALRLWNAYGSDAVAILRTRPAEVAAARIMPQAHALAAADALQTYAGMENVRIDLWGLLAGRGFPRTLIDEAIRRWGLRAPARIRRDPFAMMIAGLPGCGFLRCDAMYVALGCPPDRLKRQMLCCWKCLDDLAGQGHTWAPVEHVSRSLLKTIGADAARPRDAIVLGIRTKWIARRRDARGQLWLAVGTNARNETTIAERVHALLDWRPPTAEEMAAARTKRAAAYAELEDL